MQHATSPYGTAGHALRVGADGPPPSTILPRTGFLLAAPPSHAALGVPVQIGAGWAIQPPSRKDPREQRGGQCRRSSRGRD